MPARLPRDVPERGVHRYLAYVRGSPISPIGLLMISLPHVLNAIDRFALPERHHLFLQCGLDRNGRCNFIREETR